MTTISAQSHPSPIIVALDYASRHEALDFADRVSPRECRLKIGKEMFTLYGPDLVRVLQEKGFDIFLDLKFHDIPNTTARAVVAAAELGVWMVNVHASGGARMMETAKQALLPYGKQAPLLIAVTVLTSMDAEDLNGTGVQVSPSEQAMRLAVLTESCGLDGVVCSAWEAQQVKAECGQRFLTVTPGIRPEGSESGDQKRIMTPQRAVEEGVDYMVIGRPITQAADPAAALQAIRRSLEK